MKVELKYFGKMKISAYNSDGHETKFDVPESSGGENSAATPMQVMLESLAACSLMDVISILNKKRKTITDLRVEIEADRAEEYPKVFTAVFLKYIVISPDLKLDDLEKAVHLSHDKYCSVSAMFRAAGCEVNYTYEVVN